jgi:hypothetical protein
MCRIRVMVVRWLQGMGNSVACRKCRVQFRAFRDCDVDIREIICAISGPQRVRVLAVRFVQLGS